MPSNFSLNYPDQWRVFRAGSGEGLVPGEGFEIVTFDDPESGIRYGALRATAPGAEQTGAAKLVERARALRVQWETATEEADRDDALFEMTTLKEKLDLARSLYEVMGTVW